MLRTNEQIIDNCANSGPWTHALSKSAMAKGLFIDIMIRSYDPHMYALSTAQVKNIPTLHTRIKIIFLAIKLQKQDKLLPVKSWRVF